MGEIIEAEVEDLAPAPDPDPGQTERDLLQLTEEAGFAGGGPDFPEDMVFEVMETICKTGSIRTALFRNEISPAAFLELVDKAKEGDERAQEICRMMRTARAEFEMKVMDKLMDTGKTVFLSLLERLNPGPAEPEESPAEQNVQQANIQVIMPDNGR